MIKLKTDPSLGRSLRLILLRRHIHRSYTEARSTKEQGLRAWRVWNRARARLGERTSHWRHRSSFSPRYRARGLQRNSRWQLARSQCRLCPHWSRLPYQLPQDVSRFRLSPSRCRLPRHKHRQYTSNGSCFLPWCWVYRCGCS